MYIILGDANANTIRTRHTVLELDRFLFGNDLEESAYCVIERLGLNDFERNAELVDLHAKLIEDYRNRRWDQCASKIECLHGSWSGEMDTFYDEITTRLTEFAVNPPDENWDYRIPK